MPADALIPGPARPAECRCCHRPIPVGPVIDGMGESCARKRGLLPPRAVRVAAPVREAADNQPNLLEWRDYEELNSAEE
jgi:hypothetical protein